MTGTGPFLFEAFKFMVLQWVLRNLPRDWFSLICGFWGEINSSITFHQSHFLQGSILTAVRGFEPGMAGWNVRALPLCFVIPFNKLNKTLFCRFSREDFSLVTHSLNFRSNGVANLDQALGYQGSSSACTTCTNVGKLFLDTLRMVELIFHTNNYNLGSTAPTLCQPVIWLCCRQLSAVALKDYLGSQKYERMIQTWNWDFRFNSQTFSG